MTRIETLTFCLECGARVTDWTDGECPESADKRHGHGPLKDVQYTCAADVVELTLRIHDLEAALCWLHEDPERLTDSSRWPQLLHDVLASTATKEGQP